MARRLLLILALALPALALIVWLIAAQLPRWTAPQPNWFAAKMPGVCAAVESLTLYDAQQADVGGIGRDKALTEALKVAGEHYHFDSQPGLGLMFGESPALAVQATLPGDERRGYYVVVVPLGDTAPRKAAVVYIDAATGDPRALITATDDPAVDCNPNVRAMLVAVLKSPPSLLLIAYVVLVAAGLAAVLIARRIKGYRR